MADSEVVALFDRVLHHLDTEAAVQLTGELVRLRTVNDGPTEAGSPPVVEEPVASLVSSLMASFGWEVLRTEAAPGRPNIVGVVQGQGPGRTLMFEGHSDVVTEGDPASWSFDPYAGDIVDGNLRGRGSADMKSGIAAAIWAARGVELAGFSGRILVGVLADEEGMMLGAKHFAASDLAAEVDAVIICEPEAGEICTASKGAIRIRVEMAGKMAHGAMPHQGVNPILAVGPLLMGLGELQSALSDRYPAHPTLGEFYLTPTVVEAGTREQGNVIPEIAAVHLDIRTIPGIDHDGLITLITILTEQIATEAGLRANIIIVDDRPPVEISEDAAVVRALALAHEHVVGTPPVYGGVPGTTDGTILTRDAGLPTVVYGPGGKWIAHQVDEFVAVSDIVESTKVFALAAASFLSASAL
ncbi:M20 family peptidase [Nakamurella antarctica]|uniref:Probable succinyl-diaminopimelate desuccinylase n=2 Tax=Nakamurella antarctica TaxID=1902245 RepID=A0A3G8ZL34_9ACTN|nr:M20 family peptidase [Nakamurella antarctica]